ncbi:MAG: DUF1573 domain-containing protein [Pirellulaceae bacterium]
MKPTLFALVALALGIGVGFALTRAEFARDELPFDPTAATSPTDTTSSGPQGPQAVVVNGERHDFGTIDRYASDSHEFEVLNAGDAPLSLVVGNSTCKCTTFATEKDALAPGEKTKVKLEWTAKTGEPEFEQSAELITNDPDRAIVMLTIHGRVIDTVRPDRMQMTVNDLSANEPAAVSMRIHAYRATDLAIADTEWIKDDAVDHFQVATRPLTAAELAEEEGATSGVELTVKIASGLRLGPLSQRLKVTTNLENHDALEIPLVGNVVSDISVFGPGVIPDKLLVNLNTVPRQLGIKRTVFLTVKGPHRETTRLKIEKVVPEQEFRATLGEPTGERLIRYPLTIEIPPSSTPVARNAEETYAKIKLSVTHPQVKEMTVRVRYAVTE